MSGSPFPHALAGQFRPVAPIAEGGFGAVWKAVQVALDRPVALKLLHAGTLEDAAAVARFRDEARITAALRDPHVVQVYDSGVADGRPWIAYELVEGRTLGDAERPMPWPEARDAVKQVAAALSAAHALGILHRDIKPANVMCAGPGLYKVADFGIAKWTAGSSVRTEHGVILGTPTYISPEQVKGLPAGPEADLYALATMFFELVCGRPPFEDENLMRLLTRRIEEDPPDPRALVPSLPEDLDAFMRRALARKPEERFRTAAAFAQALDALGGEGAGREVPAAGPASARGPISRTSRKTAAVTARVRNTASRTEAIAPVAPARRAPLVAVVLAAVLILGAGAWLAGRGGGGGGSAPASPSASASAAPEPEPERVERPPLALRVHPFPRGIHVIADLAGPGELTAEAVPTRGRPLFRRTLDVREASARATIGDLEPDTIYLLTLAREGRVLVDRMPVATESAAQEKQRRYWLGLIERDELSQFASDAVRSAHDVRVVEAMAARMKITRKPPIPVGHLWVLARAFRHRELVEALIPHEDGERRELLESVIVRAMGQVRAKGASERARAVLARPKETAPRIDARMALLYQSPPHVDEILAAYPREGIDDETLRALAQVAPDRLRAYFADVAEKRPDEKEFRPMFACTARRMLGAPEDEQALIAALAAADGRTAIHAALALSRMGTARSRAALTEAIARWPDTPSILLSAGLGGDDRAGPALAERLARATRADVQRAAALALAERRGAGAPELLAATTSVTPAIAEAAAWALGRRREPGSAPALRALFDSPRDRHGVAGWALARVEPAAALGPLVKRFEALALAAQRDYPPVLAITAQALVEIGEGSLAERKRLGEGTARLNKMRPLLVPRQIPGAIAYTSLGVSPRESLGVELPAAASLAFEYMDRWVSGPRQGMPMPHVSEAREEVWPEAGQFLLATRRSRPTLRFSVEGDPAAPSRDLDERDPPFVWRFHYRMSPTVTRLD